MSQVHPDDEVFIGRHRQDPRVNPHTAKAHARHLRQLALWLRQDRRRPVLGDLLLQIASGGSRSSNNEHLIAFRLSSESMPAAIGIAAAVSAVVRRLPADDGVP